MDDRILQKHLLTMGDPTSSVEARKAAWSACTYEDTGFKCYLQGEAWSFAKGDYQTYEDLIQSVYLRIGEVAHSYTQKGSAHQWRKTVARSSMLDWNRREERRRGIVLQDRYTPGSGIEDFMGDDPQFPPSG